jgi:hypothetical protein
VPTPESPQAREWYHQLMNVDLIGDIHGHSEPLLRLLEMLGYRDRAGVFRHPDRKAVFLGDFIDRGPDQREVLDIVRPMIDGEAALSVMGNHEFNAIAYFTEDPDAPGTHLRPHTDRHRRQHRAFLDAYEGTDEHAEVIDWFRKLPLWLDFGSLRVVHACWDHRLIGDLKCHHTGAGRRLSDELLVAASRRGSDEYRAVETLLKGREISLPAGQSFEDKDGHPRQRIRVRWWDGDARTFREVFLGPESARCHIPEDVIEVDYDFQYSPDQPPVFIGHYWMEGEPEPLTPNVACVDYSVASSRGGKLMAYRWDGEQALSAEKFVWVMRDEDASPARS